MARIRSIKPGYFTSLDTAGTLTRDTRLHFAGLWTYADDDGRGLDEPRLIKAAVWALDDDIGAAEIEAMQDELSRAGRIIRYSVEGKRYFQVVNWHTHQKPNRPLASSYPHPDEDDGSTLPPLTERSRSAHGADTEDSSPEGSGGEGRGDSPEGSAAALDVPLLEALPSTNGKAESSMEWHVDRTARWLEEDREFPSRYAFYDAVLRGALDHVPVKDTQRISMGLICEFVHRANNEKIAKGHRDRLGKLVANHQPETVLYAVAQSVDWGAGMTGEHASSPDAWIDYVTAVVQKREKLGAA